MEMTESIVTLIEADLGPAHRRSGRWWFWCCPFHQDRHPSLGVTSDNGRWFCFSCRRGGDARSWYRIYRQEQAPATDPSFPPPTTYVASDTNQPPNELWQIRAHTLIAEWERCLWMMRGKLGRWHLYWRGLKGLVMEPNHLGYNPYDRYEKLEEWGLEPRSPDEKWVYLPAGVCIPWLEDDQVWKVNIRRFGGKTPKYLQIKGSRPAVYGIETLKDHEVVFIVEGELDALLLEQEAGDMIGVCTLGSASNRVLDGRWLTYFLRCHKIVLVGDNDPAGLGWVQSMGGLSRRMCWTKVPAGKDITAFWQKGGDLKTWVEDLLSQILL